MCAHGKDTLLFKFHTVGGVLIPLPGSSLVVAIVLTKITSTILLYLWISLVIPPRRMLGTMWPWVSIIKNTCDPPLPLYNYSESHIFYCVSTTCVLT